MSVLDQFKLDGKRALVTGGSKGLGLEMARALVEAGAEVVIVGRDAETLAKSAQDLARSGSKIESLAADVSSPAGAERMCEEALERYGRFDVLVNNVGGRRMSWATGSESSI